MSSQERTRLGAAVLVLVFLGITLRVTVAVHERVGHSYPGFLVSPPGFIGLKMLADRAVDLRAHDVGYADRLVAIDGRPYRGPAALRQELTLLGQAGQTLRYEIVRPNGAHYTIAAPVQRFEQAEFVAGVLPIVAAGLVGLAASLLMILAQPGGAETRLFFLAAWAALLELTILPFDRFMVHGLFPLSLFGTALYQASVLHFGLVFPVRRWPLVRYPRATVALLYLLPFSVSLYSMVTFSSVPGRIETWIRASYMPSIYLVCLPLVANSLISYFTGESTRTRRRAKLMLPITLQVAALTPLSMLWNRQDLALEMRVGISVATVMFLAASLGIVTLRFDVFEASATVRRNLARTLLASASIAGFLALHAALQYWAGMDSPWASAIVAAMLVLGCVAAISPFREVLEERISDIFFPGHRRNEETLRMVSLELAGRRAPSAAVPLLRDAIQSCLGSVSVRIVASGDDDSQLQELEPPEHLPTLHPKLLQTLDPLLQKGSVVNLGDADDQSAVSALRALAIDGGIHLVVPLPMEGGTVAGFVLGERRGGEAYGKDELAFLETLAAQSAVALDVARAWTSIRRLEQRLAEQNLYLRQELQEGHDFGEIVGEAPVLRDALAQVKQVAGSTAAVLILGETGTGKELIARAIHGASRRSDQILVKLACGAVPETLFESELFGHEKGAFTGAAERKRGRFELADAGTLFLDDVDALPLGVQAKLLRALQEGEIQPLGSERAIFVDVRIISATNKNLLAEVRAGRFREDLYYRLNVVPIQVPALRERMGDIDMLVQHFIAIESARHGRSIEGISWAALEEMRAYAWPGNIRELRNVIQRAVVLSQEPMLRLPSPLREWKERAVDDLGAGKSLDDLVRDYRAGLVERALEASGGNHRLAADLLGIHRSSFTRMLNRFRSQGGIDEPREPE